MLTPFSIGDRYDSERRFDLQLKVSSPLVRFALMSNLRRRSATETPVLQNPDDLLFQKAVALHALVLVSGQSDFN